MILNKYPKRNTRQSGLISIFFMTILVMTHQTSSAEDALLTDTLGLCHESITPVENLIKLTGLTEDPHFWHKNLVSDCKCGQPTPPPEIEVGDTPNENEVEFSSETQAHLEGFSEKGFIPTETPITFRLTCPTLDKTEHSVSVLDNGKPVPYTDLELTDDSISLKNGLSEGKHVIDVLALDIYGAAIQKKVILWTGDRSIPVQVLDPEQNPASNIEVTIKLSDDPSVMTTMITDSSGQVEFESLPSRSFNIIANSTSNQFATKPASTLDGLVILQLKGFNDPSPIENNDFSQGIDGWETGNSPVQIVPHQEATSSKKNLESNSVENRSTQARTMQDSGTFTFKTYQQVIASNVDNDLMLTTSGEGQQSISRTFDIDEGTKSVTVRFRFITSEVPGGYFGTEFNDFFNVSARTLKVGSSTHIGNSMNGLGLSAFDASGGTSWFEAELAVDEAGDTIQIDASVANVADGLYDSAIIIDAVTEKKARIDALNLNDIDGSALQFLSASSHSYFGGNTRVHGTLTISGPADESVENLSLEIIDSGVVAKGELAPGAESAIYTTFGDDEEIKIDNQQLLFVIPSAQFPAGNSTQNGSVTLRVKARTSNGEIAEKDFGPVRKLALFQGTDRYGQRDSGEGGDDWLKPTANALATQVGLVWGDFSNMNGGPFPPHTSHRTGNSADGWFSGYNARDEATATTIINQLNTYGNGIQRVYVSFTADSVFAQTIKDVTLNDGRKASDVIRHYGGHKTHFHWEIPD